MTVGPEHPKYAALVQAGLVKPVDTYPDAEGFAQMFREHVMKTTEPKKAEAQADDEPVPPARPAEPTRPGKRWRGRT